MARLYLDSNIVIRLIEEPAPGPGALSDHLAALGGGPGVHVVSDLVRMECLVKPLRADDVALVAMYEAYFGSTDVDLVPLTRAVCSRAAAIRAKWRYRTADALHLAAAVEAGCGLFATADKRLSDFTDIPMVLVTPE
jgi:uncharacterized protein